MKIEEAYERITKINPDLGTAVRDLKTGRKEVIIKVVIFIEADDERNPLKILVSVYTYRKNLFRRPNLTKYVCKTEGREGDVSIKRVEMPTKKNISWLTGAEIFLFDDHPIGVDDMIYYGTNMTLYIF